MTLKIGINGLGRIGRAAVRVVHELNLTDVEIVAVNGPAPIETHLHLLQYDSVHGRFAGEVHAEGDMIVAGKQRMKLLREKDPKALDWKALGIDLVLECSGKFTTREAASAHLAAGAKRVLVSAPCENADATIVYGVNHKTLDQSHHVISVGSCTTNALAPLARVLHDAMGIESGYMTTIHAFTGDQNLVDGSHKDLRRARAATMSMIPTSTGAAKALGLVIPELAGKLDGTSIRVPTPNVSMVDLTFISKTATDKKAVLAALTAAANGPMKNVLSISDQPLVSIDYNHTPYSSVVDATTIAVTGDKLVRVASWYDNEWGFTCRMLDVARYWPTA